MQLSKLLVHFCLVRIYFLCHLFKLANSLTSFELLLTSQASIFHRPLVLKDSVAVLVLPVKKKNKSKLLTCNFGNII